MVESYSSVGRVDEDAAHILKDILSILATSELPTPGAAKTQSLALWTLSVFKTSRNFFTNYVENLAKVLTRILSSTQENEIVIGDALRACLFR